MDVLVLTTAYAAPREGRDVRRFVRAIADGGVRATVLVPGGAEPGPVVEIGSARIVPVGDLPPMIPPAQRIESTLQLNSALAAAGSALDADVVHAIGWDAAWAGQVLARIHGAGLVWSPGPPLATAGMEERHARIVREAATWVAREAVGTLQLRQPSLLAGSTMARKRMCARAVALYERATRHAAPARARAARPDTRAADLA